MQKPARSKGIIWRQAIPLLRAGFCKVVLRARLELARIAHKERQGQAYDIFVDENVVGIRV